MRLTSLRREPILVRPLPTPEKASKVTAPDNLVSGSAAQTDPAIDISTTPDIDLRAAPRYPCRHVRVTRILAKPNFQCLVGYIRDISTTGICVRCADAIP